MFQGNLQGWISTCTFHCFPSQIQKAPQPRGLYCRGESRNRSPVKVKTPVENTHDVVQHRQLLLRLLLLLLLLLMMMMFFFLSLSLSLCTALAGLCPPFGRAGDDSAVFNWCNTCQKNWIGNHKGNYRPSILKGDVATVGIRQLLKVLVYAIKS